MLLWPSLFHELFSDVLSEEEWHVPISLSITALALNSIDLDYEHLIFAGHLSIHVPNIFNAFAPKTILMLQRKPSLSFWMDIALIIDHLLIFASSGTKTISPIIKFFKFFFAFMTNLKGSINYLSFVRHDSVISIVSLTTFKSFFRDDMTSLDFIIHNLVGIGRNGTVLLTSDIKVLVWWVLYWQWLLLRPEQTMFRVILQSCFVPCVLIGAVTIQKVDFLAV